MALKPSISSIRVFTDAERAAVILGYETIYYRTSSTQLISATAKTFPNIKSSALQKDWITITATTNALRLVKNSSNIDITLCEGQNLSPYYVAYYLSQQLKENHIDCEFINNLFVFKTDDETDTLSVGSATANEGKGTIGLSSPSTGSGSSGSNSYSGDATVEGLYTGITNDTYWIKCSGNNIFTVTPDSNNYYKGTMEIAGTFNSADSINYTITIDTANGNFANQGKGFVPTFTVVSTDTDDIPVNCEILSYNVWYEIGNKGIRIKFSEYPFGDGDHFHIDCLIPQTADGTNNTADADEAKFIVMSNEGVMQSPTLLTYVADPYTPYYKLVLEKGLEVHFEDGTFTKGDTFMVKAYMDTYYESGELDLGLVGTGEVGGVIGIRVLLKEGANKLDWCKFGFADKKELVDVGYTQTEFRAGLIGKVSPKNTNEVITINDPATVSPQFSYYLNYWEEGYFINVGCGDPVFTSDPIYFIFRAGEDELTQLVSPAFSIYYSYK